MFPLSDSLLVGDRGIGSAPIEIATPLASRAVSAEAKIKGTDMTKHAFLVTSGVFAVASVLAATPAMAKDDETIASEAQGTFTGFHSSYDIASV